MGPMRTVCLSLFACAVLACSAEAQVHTLRLPALPMADAINLLSEQTGTVIIAEAGDLSGVQAPPLSGSMAVGEALSALLSGSSLNFSSDVNGVWVVRRKPVVDAAPAKPLPASPQVRSTIARMPIAEPDRTYDTVIVTGSRAGSSSTESMSPIAVLDTADLLSPVSDDFSDVLTEILPSFFVQRRPLSDGTVFVRPYSLRNLSADHTLILVNGKRQHRSAMLNTGGAQSSDLSKIPTNAVRRVEVLRDGASAQYGSDAIAGVINIITRDDDASEMMLQYSQYYEGDGGQKRFGLASGVRGSESGVRLSLDYSDAASTSRARQRLDALQYLEEHPDADIPNPVQKWGQPEREDFRVLLTGDQQTRLGEVYGLTNVSWGQGVSDFNWRSPNTPSAYSPSSAFGDWTLYDLYPNGFKPQFGQEETDVSATVGLKGSAGTNLSYDFSAGFGENRIDYSLYNTINASMGPDSPTRFDAGGLRQRERNLNAEFQVKLPVSKELSEPVDIAFGFEHRLERYSVAAGDPASYEIGPGAESGLTSGSNGFPGYTQLQARNYDQNSWAAYLDTEVQVTTASRLGAAMRFEEFDTFGSRLSGKLSARQNVSTALMLRGTVSTGFKAPTPAQLNSERTSQGVAPDTLDVFTNGRFSPIGPVASILSEREGVSIQPLRPESSVNLSAGLVFRSLAGLVSSVDVYSIKVSNRIYPSESYTLTASERERLAALNVPGGESITTVVFYQNSFDTRTSGIDLMVDYDQPVAGGELHLGLSGNYNTTDILNASFIDNPSRVDRFEKLYPSYSAIASARYKRSGVTLDVKLRWIGPWADYTSQDGSLVQEFGSELFVDAGIAIAIDDRVTVRFGAENLFNAYPDEATLEASKGLIYSRNAPYDTDGGAYYFRISAQM